MKTITPTVEPPVAAALLPRDLRTNSYGQIMRSSVLIGGSTVVGIGLRMARAKAAAVLLGPAGVGLMGVFTSVTELIQNTVGFGLNSSGVRQIADAVGSGDDHRVARTIAIVRRFSLLLGLAGAVLTVACARPLARLSFGDTEHVVAIAWLALPVFAAVVGMGEYAVLQATRRVFDLARARVFGALSGVLLGVPLFYLFGRNGIVPAIVVAGLTTTTASWWFTRQLDLPRQKISATDARGEIMRLLRLGVVYMITDPLSVAVIYVSRIIVVQQIGTEAAGLYQAAWVLGGLYVGFILEAMGADFFPRLTPIVNERLGCTQLVNEQVEVGMLVAGPGVLATITFAPLVLHLCYSARFAPAVDVLRWICLGMLLRVASWPLGYILRARGNALPVIATEVAKFLSQVALIWLCVRRFGLLGTGIAFFGSYVFYLVLVHAVVRLQHGFRWSPANLRLGLLYGLAATAVLAASSLLPAVYAGLAGLILTTLIAYHSLQRLLELRAVDWMPAPARQWLASLKVAAPSAWDPANPS